MQYICKICNHELTNPQGLSAHCRTKHKMTAENVYIEYFLNGIPPTCNCGCGERPKYIGIYDGFRKYKLGHAARIHNNWGHNPEVIKKSHETQKKMYQNGELIVWNKGLDISDIRVKKNTDSMLKHPTRNQKISKALKGRKRPKSVLDALNTGMLVYWSKPENRDLKRINQSKFLREVFKKNKSELEIKFESFLVELKIQYLCQFPLDGYLFDFYIPKYNILIEVDGDWFHCNPDIHPSPIYETQKITVKNDEKKNKVVKDNNITLLRFWEKDINENPEKVKAELCKYI